MLVRLLQLAKAAFPILMTGLPSMVFGMISSPVAERSQSVMVTTPPVVVHVRSSKLAAFTPRAERRKDIKNFITEDAATLPKSKLLESEASDTWWLIHS